MRPHATKRALTLATALAIGTTTARADYSGSDMDLRRELRATERTYWATPDPLAPHLADVVAEGQAVYSVPITLPPAILAPNLAFVYSSATQVSREVGYGWTLDGILQIERPT